MIGEIYIEGVIGSFEDETGQFQKGVELQDIIAQYKKQKLNRIINVKISSPGGSVVEGDAIHDYLESLKKDHIVNTETTGSIGSIATKIYLVGQERIISEGHDFMIHNPWIDSVTGDSNELKSITKQMEGHEKSLRSFYMAKTGLGEHAIRPLMDKEAKFEADMAIELGFATKKKEFKVLAFIKNEKTMSNNKGILARIEAMLKGQDEPQPKSMLVDLEGGSQVYVLTEDETLEGKAVVVAEGGEPTETAAPDGDHLLADGRTITVEAGIITAVSEGSEEPEEELQANEAILKAVQTLAEQMQNFQDTYAKDKEAYAKEKEEAKAKEDEEEKVLNEIRALIQTGNAPKPKHKKQPVSTGGSLRARAKIKEAEERLNGKVK